MSENGTIGIILGAAKVQEELVPIFGSVPASLIPINGKPVIFFLLERFRSLGIRQVYVSVGYLEEKVRAILNVYSDEDSFRVIPVKVDSQKRPGSALLDIIQSIPEQERKANGVYIQLADTIFSSAEKFPLERNFIVVSADYTQSERWCVIDRNPNDKRIAAIYDKQKGYEGKFAAVGVYHFVNAALWDDMKEQNYEISALLEHALKKGEVVEVLEKGEWFDLGHLEKYYQAKARLLSPRAFNELRLGKFMNTVVKRSTRNEILKDEILWYANLPKELQIYAPRMIDSNVQEKQGEIYAEFEFYGYPSLANLWLYGDFSFPIWQAMIDRVFSILQRFQSFPREVKFEDSLAMYVQKTELRVAEAKKASVALSDLFCAESVLINGKKFKGWPSFQGRLEEFARMLYAPKDQCFLHGDFCFSNILFDLNYGVVKLVDPRGKWGSESFYGDIKYDAAKLRHSSSGLYDHIVQGHVNVAHENGKEPSITISFPLANDLHRSVKDYVDQKISEKWDLNKIKLIEGLLFISMIPLHPERQNRQIAMFAQGIQLLNEAPHDIL